LSRIGAYFLARQRGLGGLHLFQIVEVFEEEKPGGLLGVVELGGASGLAAEDVVNVFEGLFEHRGIWERLIDTFFYTSWGTHPLMIGARGAGSSPARAHAS